MLNLCILVDASAIVLLETLNRVYDKSNSLKDSIL